MSSVEVIRSAIREDGKQERKDRRDNILDKNRSALGEVSENLRTISNPDEIKDLAVKLKQRGRITVRQLKMLQHAFIQSEDNISAFLHVSGALHALVRELSGSNTQFQLVAASCCCNLALGNPKVCLQVVKAAAPYLISSLDGLNSPFLDTCVWTLGNLAGSDPKSWAILKSQGVLPKFVHLLSSFSDDIKRSAIYALSQFIKTGIDDLETSELELIAKGVLSVVDKEPSVYWLMFLLSCSSLCSEIFLKNCLLSSVFKLLNYEVMLIPELDPVKTTALLRTLANLCSNQVGSEEFIQIYDSKPEFVQMTVCVLLTSTYSHIQRETLWLIANVAKCAAEMQQTSALLSGIHHELNEALLKTAMLKP